MQASQYRYWQDILTGLEASANHSIYLDIPQLPSQAIYYRYNRNMVKRKTFDMVKWGEMCFRIGKLHPHSS